MKTSFDAYDNNGDGLVLITDKLRAKIHEEAKKLELPEIDDNLLKTFLSGADTDRDKKLSWKGNLFCLVQNSNNIFSFLKGFSPLFNKFKNSSKLLLGSFFG